MSCFDGEYASPVCLGYWGYVFGVVGNEWVEPLEAVGGMLR